MINCWKSYYKDVPVILGGIDYYKITFPLVKGMETREKAFMTLGDTHEHENAIFGANFREKC